MSDQKVIVDQKIESIKKEIKRLEAAIAELPKMKEIYAEIQEMKAMKAPKEEILAAQKEANAMASKKDGLKDDLYLMHAELKKLEGIAFQEQ